VTDAPAPNPATHAQNALCAAADHHRVLSENGSVLPDSRTMAGTPPLGGALWAGPIGPHYVRNVGDADLDIVAVEVEPGA
jgi:hypothetical protein